MAGVVVLTDGRDTPATPIAETISAIKELGVKVFPIPVVSVNAPTNIDLQSVSVQDSAFKGDIVNVKVLVRGTGYEPNHPVILTLKNKKTGLPLPPPDGGSADQKVMLPDDKPVEAELRNSKPMMSARWI